MAILNINFKLQKQNYRDDKKWEPVTIQCLFFYFAGLRLTGWPTRPPWTRWRQGEWGLAWPPSPISLLFTLHPNGLYKCLQLMLQLIWPSMIKFHKQDYFLLLMARIILWCNMRTLCECKCTQHCFVLTLIVFHGAYHLFGPIFCISDEVNLNLQYIINISFYRVILVKEVLLDPQVVRALQWVHFIIIV